MKKIIYLIYFFTSQFCCAQNLVLNSSFEDTISCPTTLGQISLSQNWFNPNDNTPDFFHECNTSSWPNLPDIPGIFGGINWLILVWHLEEEGLIIVPMVENI